MGNQLTGIAPSQILPVEQYLTDVADYEFDSSLGSTRFFKVARARYREGLAVVKVFVIHGPSLPLKSHKDQLEAIKTKLQGASNCLPFMRVTLSEKAALLFRQYIKDSLYDRISTRPFLIHIEKRWVAFQLLCALNQCHKQGVCHGDIKSENVLITGWNWLLLTDFASFKPTYLPEDNPSDFSYFFDTSRRRTCYIAPERFVESSWKNLDPSSPTGSIDLTTSEVKKGDLMPAMDIFSAGCVIAELFSEGSPPFDLSQLLSYRTGDYSPSDLINNIEDPYIKELVSHMLQRDPGRRLSAEEYLVKQRGRAFPDYFYTFLKLYLQRFASPPLMPPDDRIHRIHKDLPTILQNMGVDEEDRSSNHSLVLVFSMVTASLRSLRFCSSKLVAVEILQEMSKYVSAEVILDRLLPYMLFLVNDHFPRVRAEALKCITQALERVDVVPISDANIYPEYILPQLSHLTQDPVTEVRVAYAENIAVLAETALRFLEKVQLAPATSPSEADTTAVSSQNTSTYDTESQALQEMIQQKVVTLLSDPDNIVKQTLLENGITQLCVFFGRQKANDVLLSHMITFLNDKQDWHLRGAFFDSIVGVASYVGWQSCGILKPLLEQGLSDPEEFVVNKTLSSMTSLTELGLLTKPILHELLQQVVPFFAHPGVWICQGAVGFVAAMARVINIADVHCNLLPLVRPFLKQQVVQASDEVMFLHALKGPVPRAIFDYFLRCPQIDLLFDHLKDRQLIRNIARPGHKPNYTEMEDALYQIFRKLGSMGLTEQHEDKLLTLREFVLKVHRSRAGSTEAPGDEEDPLKKEGTLDLSILGNLLTRRHAILPVPTESKEPQAMQSKRTSKKKVQAESPITSMNEDWKQMFGSSEDSIPVVHKMKTDAPERSRAPPGVTQMHHKPESTMMMSQLESKVEGKKVIGSSTTQAPTGPHRASIHGRYASCFVELSELVLQKRQEYANEHMTKDTLDTAQGYQRAALSNWKPKGLLIAHLHEHRASINRIQVSPDQQCFATCSNDGTVKLWDCSRMEGRSVTNRSRHTYSKQGGQIKNIVFSDGSSSIASVSDSGSIHVLKLESRLNLLLQRSVNTKEEGQIMDISYYNTGSQSILVYATAHGHLVGWDLRAPGNAWTLKNTGKHGLITSFDVHHQQSWLAVGTSSGTLVCWDMRFQLPISTISHPTGARVRRLLTHPLEQSQVISAAQGNNEVSMWDMETGARHRALWASSAPPLSLTQTSSHSVNGMYVGAFDSNLFLLTAGSDMRVRFWDLSYPSNSHIVAGAAGDPVNQTLVAYRSRLIDGTEVVQETYSKPRQSATDDIPRRSPDSPPSGHHDVITDINLCQTSQCFLITSSRDGVIKVWK